MSAEIRNTQQVLKDVQQKQNKNWCLKQQFAEVFTVGETKISNVFTFLKNKKQYKRCLISAKSFWYLFHYLLLTCIVTTCR